MKVLNALVTVLVASASASAWADDVILELPDPTAVTISALNSNGSGCSGGLSDQDVLLADDGSALLVDMGALAALAGTGLSPRDAYKVCSVSLQLNAPQGWTYRIASATFDFGARLPQGVEGKLSIETWIQGVSTDRETQELRLSGPIGQRDTATLVFDDAVFVPCDQSRALNFSVRAQVGFSRDFARVRYLSPVAYNLEWQRCP